MKCRFRFFDKELKCDRHTIVRICGVLCVSTVGWQSVFCHLFCENEYDEQ